MAAQRDDLEATLKEIEKEYPDLISELCESIHSNSHSKLVMVLTDEMTDEEKEMRCYAYYLQKGYTPVRAEQEAQELLLMLDSMGQTFH